MTIQLEAVDYLLKPIDIDELIAAVAKAEVAVKKKTSNQRLEKMISNINLIGITMSDGIEFAPVDHIVRCEANGFYTWFYIDGSKNILATKNLKKFEEQLQQHHYFCRVHSSHLVNINYLKNEQYFNNHLIIKTLCLSASVFNKNCTDYC